MITQRSTRPAAAVQKQTSLPAPRPFFDAAAHAGPAPSGTAAHDFKAIAVSHGADGSQGAGVIQRQPEDQKKRSNLMDTMRAFLGSKVGPLPQGPRSDLDSSLRQYPQKKLFTSALDWTNKGLGVNTDAPLPSDKAQKYVSDAAEVQSGTMSSTRAFARSGMDWSHRGNYVASAANFGGMMGSAAYEGGGYFLNAINKGMQENIARKTGRWNPKQDE